MPSEKILEKKIQLVASLTEELMGANVGVLVNFKGITVEDDTKLRKDLREAGCTYRVIKNTILKRAFEEAGIEGLDDCLFGTTALAFAADDYVSAPKVLSEFAEKQKSFEIKGGFVDGKAVSVAQIETLAKLPPKEVLLAQVLYGFNAPIQGLATVLNGTIRALCIALDAIAGQKAA